MINYVYLAPPVTIDVAGNHRVFGVGRGVLMVNVVNHQGSTHPAQLPVTILPGLGRHLFSWETAAVKGVNMVIAKRSYLDLGDFKVLLRKDGYCCTLDHLDLTTAAEN